MVESRRALRTAFFAGALIALATLSVREAAEARQREGGEDVSIRAAAGVAGAVKAGRWAPVLITVESSAPTFSGDVVVSWSDVRVRRMLAFASPGRRQLELYVRTSEPENTMRVRLISGTREVQAVDVPVRIVPSAEPVTLCLEPSDAARQEACTVRAGADSLPRSSRGYDVVDSIDASVAVSALPKDQREAMLLRMAVHSLDVSGDAGLVQRPSRPSVRRGLPAGVIQAVGPLASLFLISFAGAGITLARRRTRARWLWTTAVVIVIAATVATQAVGRIGPGAAIVVHHNTLLEQIPGTTASNLSMRGLAELQAQGSFVLRLPTADGVLEPASSREGIEQIVDETGQPVITGSSGLASRQAFAAEAVVNEQPLAVAQRGGVWTITNNSKLALERCRFADGFSTTEAGAMPPGATLTAREIGEVLGPAFTCQTRAPVVPVLSPDRTVRMQGTTVIAVYKSRPGAEAHGL